MGRIVKVSAPKPIKLSAARVAVAKSSSPKTSAYKPVRPASVPQHTIRPLNVGAVKLPGIKSPVVKAASLTRIKPPR